MSNDPNQPAIVDPTAPPPLDPRLVQWLAVQIVYDARARLVEGGADGDTRIELASVFVDLPAMAHHGRAARQTHVVHELLARDTREPPEDPKEPDCVPHAADGVAPRWLIVGGPGTGKSTATTMAVQLLRLTWVERQAEALPEALRSLVLSFAGGLHALANAWGIYLRSGALPLRVSLPALARWMASQSEGVDDPVWRHLASKMADEAAHQGLMIDASGAELRAMVGAASEVLWIFDGLDEVPRTAGRERVIAAVREAMEPKGRPSRLVVTTRPQGYEGEFSDLSTLVLEAMPGELARQYGERLLRAWAGGEDAGLSGRQELLRGEFARPEIQALVQTPLHATMATLLVASEGSLPSARCSLFEHYFDTIFRRELGKPMDFGVRREERSTIFALHARIGLTLHVRAQAQAGASPTLSRRALRETLAALFQEQGFGAEAVQANVERMMRFAAERLVLLLHVNDGGYAFGVRSLQEFFTAAALLEGDRAQVRLRFEAIALTAHWANVLALAVSNLALRTGLKAQAEALDYTTELCRALNSGAVGGEAAARCMMGSRLAIAMLHETEGYGKPWLHEPLWAIALEAAPSPVQSAAVKAIQLGRSEPNWPDGSSMWRDPTEIHTRLGVLAVRWPGDDAKNWRRRVLEKAESLLGGASGTREAGWRLLHGPLMQDDPEAIRLAELNAPGDLKSARGVVQELLNAWWESELAEGLDEHSTARIPNWLDEFTHSHMSWFPPGWLLGTALNTAGLCLVPSAMKAPMTLAPRIASSRRDGLRLTGQLVRGMLLPLEGTAPPWEEIASKLPEDGPEWFAWKRVALFLAAPSHERLADALDATTESAAYHDIQSNRWWFPWPLAACLDCVDRPEELATLAARVREGALGTVEDWRCAEARWRSSPEVGEAELERWLLPSTLPWTKEIASHGIVFNHVRCAYDVATNRQEFHALLEKVLSSVRSDPEHARNAWRLLSSLLPWAGFVELDGWSGDGLPLDFARQATTVKGSPWSRRMLFFVDQLAPDLEGSEAERWFTLLDGRGRTFSNLSSGRHARGVWLVRRHLTIAAALVRRLNEHPEQWGLMQALLVMLRSLPNADISVLRVPDLPDGAPPRAHALREVLLLLTQDVLSQELAERVRSLHGTSPDGDYDLRPLLAEILMERARHPERSARLLLATLTKLGDSDAALRDQLLGALFAQLPRSVRSVFSTPEAWEEHQLPKPFLAGQATRSPERIVRLAELTNVRLFKYTPTVDVPFPVPVPDHGQWIVLVGENGVGKTTLLRALALGLASPAVASKLLDERLPLVRNGGEGRIGVELVGGAFRAVVRRDPLERTETVTAEEVGPSARPWVVGYGVRRGNACGEKDREHEWGPLGELHTLFDRPASLVNAVEWLKELDRQVLREQRQQAKGGEGSILGGRTGVWRSVASALKTLLDVTEVEPDEDHIFVKHRDFGRVRFDALSDGYLTTAGWIIDLIARWIERQRELDEAVGPDLLRQMTGFVLIDEIDLHLHPVWQMHIIEDVRQLFPRMSFVVTTHNPLALQGARRGEVYVMRRDGDRIELVQRDIRPGHDVDRVLLEQFGVEHTFDRETRELLQLHREALERGEPSGGPERASLEAQLAERLGAFGALVGQERRSEHDPLPRLNREERDLLSPFLKKR
jgi:energy-coupling factor transporter ATP-binding protein EcfA2